MEAVLEARALCGGYGGVPVIRGLSFVLSKGEWLLVLGPNGSGKSTLLRLLLGYLPPLSGQVFLGGRPLSALGARERGRWIGLLPQEPASPFAYTVEEVVLMGRFPHLGPWGQPGKRDWAAVRAALERLGLGALAARPITELSGGERKLVFLARLLAQEPAVFLLDEPQTHLDLAHRRVLWAVLQRLKAGGASGIVVTHELQFPWGFFDRVLALQEGRAFAEGKPNEVLTEGVLSALYGTSVRIYGEKGGFLAAPRF